MIRMMALELSRTETAALSQELGDSESCDLSHVTVIVIRPRNPRTTPTKSTVNFASAKLGVVHILPFSEVPTIRTPPPKIPPNEESLLWGWCVVGGPLL